MPRSTHACQQKSNPSCDPVLLSNRTACFRKKSGDSVEFFLSVPSFMDSMREYGNPDPDSAMWSGFFPRFHLMCCLLPPLGCYGRGVGAGGGEGTRTAIRSCGDSRRGGDGGMNSPGHSWKQIHESTISLRFLGIILRVLRLEVSEYNV
jgi:hypothetical protein